MLAVQPAHSFHLTIPKTHASSKKVGVAVSWHLDTNHYSQQVGLKCVGRPQLYINLLPGISASCRRATSLHTKHAFSTRFKITNNHITTCVRARHWLTKCTLHSLDRHRPHLLFTCAKAHWLRGMVFALACLHEPLRSGRELHISSSVCACCMLLHPTPTLLSSIRSTGKTAFLSLHALWLAVITLHVF